MSTNPQFAAPSAQVTGSFTAPENNNTSRTKLPVEPIPQGLQMCTIFGLVALGTHMESFQNSEPSPKTKILVAFEFPQFKRKFYEEDEGPRSAAIMSEMVFAAYSDKAKLRKIIEAACQRSISDDEARNFDVSKLMGATIMVNVKHYTKKDGTIGEKADAYMPITNMPVPHGYAPENSRWLFYLDNEYNNFRSEMFANLPHFLKSKLIESMEGQAYIAKGGIFAKLDQTENSNSNSNQANTQQYNSAVQTPVPPSMASPKKSIQMLVNDFTYEAYQQQGWTDEALVNAGFAKWIQPSLPSTPPPAQQAPSAPVPPPSTPVPAPMQSAPSAAPIQQVPQAQNPSPAQTWLEDEDDDMPF